MNTNLYHLFTANEKHYCYDTTSNNLFQVNPLLRYVLALLKNDEITDSPTEIFSKDNVTEALNNIEKEKVSRNLFRAIEKVNITFPYSKKQYENMLSCLQHHMILNITESCNMRCCYCKYSGKYQGERTHSGKSMDWDTIQKSIDFFIAHSQYYFANCKEKLTIGFYGGEPLTCFTMIKDAVEYLKKTYPEHSQRMGYSITTNGVLLDREVADFLISNDFVLFISLDGPEQIHDRYRKTASGENTFRIVFENVKYLELKDKDYFNSKVGFSVVFAPEYNFPVIADFFEKTFGKKKMLMVSDVCESGTNFFDQFNMVFEGTRYEEQLEELRKAYFCQLKNRENCMLHQQLFEKRIKRIHLRDSWVSDVVHPNGICLPGLDKLFVDSDGNFHMCERINGHFSLGNLVTGFNYDKIFDIIDQYLKVSEKCSNCWAVRFCTLCFTDAIFEDKISKEEKDINCKSVLVSIQRALIDYVTFMDEDESIFQHLKNEPSQFSLLCRKYINEQ